MQAFAFYLSLTQIIRLCLTGHFDKEDVPPGLADLLLAVTAMPDFSVMEAQLRDMSETVRDDFDRIIGGKAG
jgi:glutamate-ammonia-ligase adenylyltransferase